jgi:predicted DNA-binding ribbon-helix-helix protein
MPDSADLTRLARPRKHSVTVGGHATSLSLEDAFWHALKDAAASRGMSVNALLTEIDAARSVGGAEQPPVALSAAVRVWLLQSARGGAAGV